MPQLRCCCCCCCCCLCCPRRGGRAGPCIDMWLTLGTAAVATAGDAVSHPGS
jgi:hypothetical protein